MSIDRPILLTDLPSAPYPLALARRLYEGADRVLRRLQGLQDQLRGAIEKANEMAHSALGDSSTPLGAILAVLNNNVDLLMAMDSQVDDLGAKLERMIAVDDM